EGVNLSSLLFGNAAGLVETRRGKLDGQAPVLEKLAGTVQAGDVLLEKTPFRLTDTFIPGHYGHVAVWVGSEAELRRLGIWEHPVVRPYQANIRAGRGVVEALRSGVKMNTLRHFLNIDDLAVLRPRQMADTVRAEAVLQTLRQVGKAYDFNFDVESTDRIVCSELVYHAYGDVRWPTKRQLGRVTISPDNVAAEATGNGAFAIELLYHDGREQTAGRGEFVRGLLKSDVVRMARGGDGAR
ncbi:MAG TPA: YiiX/YebB-like N1pC/P60 family cysteine hydrolase, partial [Azonexus sp.]|nr:YiiX/YebB-like N1pC/P60 family cysteine hydrolase [Azonexus sp.]